MSSHSSRLNFSLGADDDRYIPGLSDAIAAVTGLPPVVAHQKGRSAFRHVYVHAPVLARLVRAIGMSGIATQKQLPDLMFNVAENHQLAFLEGYFLGEGTKAPTGRRITLATSSPDLANGLLYLLHSSA